MNHLVIMAGGVGSRFWPLSSKEHPKQFLDVLGCGMTLLQLTVKRFEGIVPMENVWVVTSKCYEEEVKRQLPNIPAKNVLLEPCRKNTAPCVCYVSYKIKTRDPKANIIVAPSDHIIADVDEFRKVVTNALNYADETDAIMTLGMRPEYPATGYGYIKADLTFSSARNKGIYRVDAFKEKPTLEIAQEYIKLDYYYWNSGIFIWSVNTIVNAFRIHEPEMAEAFENLMPIYDTDKEQAAIDQLYPTLQNISVDYSILENAEEIFVCPANFGWSDLGSWSSLRDHLRQDSYGNAQVGNDIKCYETHHTIVHTHTLKKVVIQGLDDYVVAERDGTLLICKLSEEQRIKLFHED